MPKLWELTNELRAVRDEIEDNDDALDERLEFMLDQVLGGIQRKVSGIGRLLNWCELQKKGAQELEDAYKKSRKVYEATIARLEKYVTDEMARAELDSVTDEDGLGVWEIKLTRGETEPRDFSKIPDDFIRIKRELKKTELRKVIDAGLIDPEAVGVEIVKKAKLKFTPHKAVPAPRKGGKK